MFNSLAKLFNHHQFRQYLAGLIATFAFMSTGMNVGWSSAVLPKLLSDNPPVLLSLDEISWVIAIMNISNMISPYPSGFLMDRYGRKNVLVTLSILPVASWVLIIIGESTLVLCIARLLSGLWQGIVYTVLPVYIAEISEPKFRSQMGTLISFMTYVGLLITFIIGPMLSYTGVAIVSGIVPIIFFLTFVWIPESPVYFVIHNNYLKAEKSLIWFRGSLEKGKITQELETIVTSIAKDMENKGRIKDIFKTRGTIKAFIIANGLAFCQRFCGIYFVVIFSSSTLPECGFLSLSREKFVIVFPIVLVIFTLISSFLIKHFGNVQLLVTSSLGCGICMFVTGEWFYLRSVNNPYAQLNQWIPYVFSTIHAIFFSIGLGILGNSIKGELFPTNIRAVSSALVTNIGSIAAFIQNKTFFRIMEVYGIETNYWFSSVCCIASAIFSYSFVIETKGKSLNEIQEELERKV